MERKSSDSDSFDDSLSSQFSNLILDSTKTSTDLINFSTAQSEDPPKTKNTSDYSTSSTSNFLDNLEENSENSESPSNETVIPASEKYVKNVTDLSEQESKDLEDLEAAQDFHRLWNQDQESMYRRLSACYQADPENFHDKLKTILEESSLDNTDAKDTSGVSLDKLNGEFLKICKFISDETMPEWPPSFSEKVENAKPETAKDAKLGQLIRGMVTGSPMRKIGEFFRDQVNDTKTFEQLEQLCDENFERPKSSLSSVASSVVLDTSTRTLYEKCERQMASLEKDVSLEHCLDDAAHSSEEEFHTPEASPKNSSRYSPDDVNLQKQMKFASKKSPLYDPDDLDLQEEIRIRQKRRLEMEQLMKEINSQTAVEGNVCGEDNMEENFSERSQDLDYSNITLRSSQRSFNHSARKVKESAKKPQVATSQSAIPKYTGKFSSQKKLNTQTPMLKPNTKLKTPSTTTAPRFLHPTPSCSSKKQSEKSQVLQKNLPGSQKPKTPLKVNRNLFPTPSQNKIPEPEKTKIKPRRSKSWDSEAKQNLKKEEKKEPMTRINSESRLMALKMGQPTISGSSIETKTKTPTSKLMTPKMDQPTISASSIETKMKTPTSRLMAPKMGQPTISALSIETKTKTPTSGIGKKATYFASPGRKVDPGARKKPTSYFKDPVTSCCEKKLLGSEGRLASRTVNDKFENVVSPVGMYVRYKDKNLITNVKAGNDEWMCTPKDGSDSTATLPFKLKSPMIPSIAVTDVKEDCGIPQVQYNLPKNVHVIKESPKIFPCRGVLEPIENKVVQRHQGRIRTPGKSQNSEQLHEDSAESIDMSLLVEKPANNF